LPIHRKENSLSINGADASELYTYGAEKVIEVKEASLTSFNAKAYTAIIKQVADAQGSSVIIIDSSIDGLTVGSLVAVALEAGYASNAVSLPETSESFVVKRKAFSNKAFSNTEISTEKKVIGVAKNSYGAHENSVSGSTESFSATLPELKIKSESINKATGTITIADADIVVSAGRGMKGPENWGMIEELADVLGAATACSKPVSDLGWRPHGEHVGQTGKPVAPFFKAADYGIVGDAFEVVPQLIEKLKAFKQA